MQPTIINASFIKSAPKIDDAVNEGVSEVVFMGRSNVGKSSTLNRLCNRKNLAKSSATPGKTRLINFFDVTYRYDDADFHARFVDLPGFGYAKVSKQEQKQWQEHLTRFITDRVSIRTFVHLVDARHQTLQIDKDVKEFIASILRPDQVYIRVYTKIDKLKQNEIAALHKEGAVTVSNLKNRGIEKLNSVIFNALFEV
ncbi:MAG: ribosome biogenesis GTP-binding protein YihA/YsxC [Campylobacterota bacterium]